MRRKGEELVTNRHLKTAVHTFGKYLHQTNSPTDTTIRPLWLEVELHGRSIETGQCIETGQHLVQPIRSLGRYVYVCVSVTPSRSETTPAARCHPPPLPSLPSEASLSRSSCRHTKGATKHQVQLEAEAKVSLHENTLSVSFCFT